MTANAVFYRLCWLLACPFTVAAQVSTVPPATYTTPPEARHRPVATLLTPDAGPRLTIALPAPSVAEQAPVTLPRPATLGAGTGAVTARKAPRRVGFPRLLPEAQRAVDLLNASWQRLGDGGRALRIEIRSPGAAALRFAITLSTVPGAALRFRGSSRPQQVFGPVAADRVTASKPYWSPVLEGDTGILEIYLPPKTEPADVHLELSQISHLTVAGTGLAAKSQPVDDIGLAQSCEVDIACVQPSAALLNQAKAVAKLVFTEDGNTYVCTGTMLNDSIRSFTPYLLTASQCLDSQQAASSLNTYWFFEASTCGSLQPPPYALVEGGATLLARSVDYDWALVRLNGQPAPGTTFSAWRAESVSPGIPISVLHHPQGDLEKYSQGVTGPYADFSDRSSFITATYGSGSTEDGSTGAAFATFFDAGGYYEVRGTLFGGDASCTAPGGSDYYSRLDFALPLVAQYLSPGAANPSKMVPVVEYYFSGFDDYFITADPAEIQALDNGAHPGWVRTGLTFLAYADPAFAPAGVRPVCRFYVLPQYGDSHFYSADQAECAATAARFAGSWVEESAALFYIQIPDPNTGACPAGTRPVYRFLNQTNQIHHRYTGEVDVRDCLISDVPDPSGVDPACRRPGGPWLQEGYGTPPDAPVMCSPTGNSGAS